MDPRLPEEPEVSEPEPERLEQKLAVLASLSDEEPSLSPRSTTSLLLLRRRPRRARERLYDGLLLLLLLLLLRREADDDGDDFFLLALLPAAKPLRATCWSTAWADFLCSSSRAAWSVAADPLSTGSRRFPRSLTCRT